MLGWPAFRVMAIDFTVCHDSGWRRFQLGFLNGFSVRFIESFLQASVFGLLFFFFEVFLK